MNVREALKITARKLEDAGIDDAYFEAKCLVEFFTELSQTQIIFGDTNISDKKLDLINAALEKRMQSYPLQYILGTWEFMGYTFSVGEGVLIPRPETELLVELAIKKLKNVKSPIIFDLCSGSGCIGLSIAKARKDAKVFLIEKYDKAFNFLTENVKKLEVENAIPVQCDITEDVSDFCLPIPDMMVSNPPYIPSCEIEGLQSEVKKEPVTALDGGDDGMDFYRVIANKWLPNIKRKGSFLVECDPTQATFLAKMFLPQCTNVNIIRDLNGDPRIVCGDIY